MNESRLTREIKGLEQAARVLEPSAAQRDHLIAQVVACANDYLDSIASAPAFAIHAGEGQALYDAPIVEEGIDIEQALRLLRENVNLSGIGLSSGRYLGYIPGGGLLHAALGDYLAAITNRYAGLFFASPGAVRVENMLLRWMAGVVGYPASSAGNLSSGGSIANLTAIVTAREACGVIGSAIGRAVVYVTDHAHHCIDKALRIAGLGGCVVRRVCVDAGYRMDAIALDEAILADERAGLHPWLVVASAGTTNTGAVDPLSDVADIAAAHRLWFHVDGAYGALFALCPEGQAVLAGMDKSDSVVLDPHKTLFLPYGTGAVLVKDRTRLHAAFSAQADYIQNILDEVGELSPADLSPELTKHFRGLRLWLPLKLLGVAPFRAALSEKIYLARYFYERLCGLNGFEVGPYPDLSIVTYRYLPRRGDTDAFNQQLMQRVQRDGRIFVSSTRVDGKLVLRAAILCFRTHLAEIEEALDVLAKTAQVLEAE
ncbi:MAG: amino acid decarboxylase [Anaerolineae bacterium]|nr:amino acid decarboxylase [Anaerolineae bacterium]